LFKEIVKEYVELYKNNYWKYLAIKDSLIHKLFFLRSKLHKKHNTHAKSEITRHKRNLNVIPVFLQPDGVNFFISNFEFLTQLFQIGKIITILKSSIWQVITDIIRISWKDVL